ncbi:MAG: hypothetical protein B7Z74_07930 [Deltaproteobacteria bacterium 21-66-5]|nr:MAG: hypothetical protein B7Z74_07930 [Deltaproteobacteria bacterium 21-66-5]
MSVGEAGIVADVVIVGGGPAGILLAHHFREHGIRHKVLERGKVGQSWRDMRPGMVLLSPGVPGTDWTSLTLDHPIWSYPGVRRPFPTREDFLCYVDAFARDRRVEVWAVPRAIRRRPRTGRQPAPAPWAGRRGGSATCRSARSCPAAGRSPGTGACCTRATSSTAWRTTGSGCS